MATPSYTVVPAGTVTTARIETVSPIVAWDVALFPDSFSESSPMSATDAVLILLVLVLFAATTLNDADGTVESTLLEGQNT